MRTGYSKEQDERQALRLEKVIKTLKNFNVQDVLDLGCGDGQLIELLSFDKQFKKIIGIDPNPNNLKIARHYIHNHIHKERNNSVRLLKGTIRSLGNSYRNFQAIVLVEVIEHIDPNKLPGIEEEIFGYLRPNLIVITSPLSDPNVSGGARTKEEMKKLGHYFEWTIQQGMEWASNVGKKYKYKYTIQDIRVSPSQRGSQLIVFCSHS